MLALSACVGLWAGRLGTYLFARISEEKGDSRFDGIRGKPLVFGGAFVAQATVSLFLLLLSLNTPSLSFYISLEILKFHCCDIIVKHFQLTLR